jgi:hypothetical protein
LLMVAFDRDPGASTEAPAGLCNANGCQTVATRRFRRLARFHDGNRKAPFPGPSQVGGTMRCANQVTVQALSLVKRGPARGQAVV